MLLGLDGAQRIVPGFPEQARIIQQALSLGVEPSLDFVVPDVTQLCSGCGFLCSRRLFEVFGSAPAKHVGWPIAIY
jgi:hypothetical protein